MRLFRSTAVRGTGALAAALALAACGGGGESGGGGGGGGGEAQGDPESGVVTVLHSFTGENDIAGFDAIVAEFEKQHPGIDVQAQGTNTFEQLARTRVGGGNPPDIMSHPQPGLLREFAVDQGAAVPLDFIDRAQLEESLIPGVAEYGTFEDELYAVPVKFGFKSLVYYNKPAFEAGGYQIPETQEDLLALTEQVIAAGQVPWCIGIESSEATGWVATDWVEDILLRTLGAEDYDRWVAGELDFASPEVTEALETYMAPIWTNDAAVFGGRQQIVRENFGTAIGGLVTDPPECLMHKAPYALESFLATANPNAKFGTDYDFFYYPAAEGGEKPALVAGDLAALYTDNAAAQTFMQFLATPEAGEAWAANPAAAYLSGFQDFDPAAYGTESARKAAEILSTTDFAKFDGSDLMPADVGASSQEGSFWLEMTQFVSGNQELPDSLQQIDEHFDEVAGS